MLTSKFAKLSKRKGAKNAFLVGLYNELTGGIPDICHFFSTVTNFG